MSFDDLKKIFVDVKSKLDLTNRFKVHKGIFRFALIAILGLTLFVGFTDGFDVLVHGSVGMCCSELGGCHNPFYAPLSSDPMTKDAIILVGECVGDAQPSFFSQRLGFVSWLIVLAAFGLNYLYWRFDGK